VKLALFFVALAAGCFEAPARPCWLGPDISCPALHDAGPDVYAPPSATELVPAGDSTNVPIDTVIRVTFDRAVTGVSSTSFRLLEGGDIDGIHATVAYDEATRAATLVPDQPLFSSTRYLAQLGSAITGIDGTALVGTTSWTFVTASDLTPPHVTMLYPTPDSTGAGVDIVLVATFDEQISNITSTSFLLTGPNGQLAGTIGYVSQTAVSLTPKAQLVGHTTYSGMLTADIRDFGGNMLSGAPVNWSFTTGDDTVPPAVDSVIPAEDDTEVLTSTPIRVLFTESVVGVSDSTFLLETGGLAVPATVTYTDATRKAQLIPTTSLAPTTEYMVTVGPGITDIGGNSLPAKTWTFTTQ
jgi:hypothetical protein